MQNYKKKVDTQLLVIIIGVAITIFAQMFEKKNKAKGDEDVENDVSSNDMSAWLSSIVNDIEDRVQSKRHQIDTTFTITNVEPSIPSREAVVKSRIERRTVVRKSEEAPKPIVDTLPQEGIRVTKDEKPQVRCVDNKRIKAMRNELRRAVIWSEIMPPKYKEY